MRWEMKQLEDAVRLQHGDAVADSLHIPTESIAWKIDMGYYHACESVRVLKEAIYDSEVISENDHESIAGAKAIILSATGDPRATPLNAARFHAEAHTIAAAQSLHSTADIMASVVFWALNFPQRANAPDEHHLYLYKVRGHLQNEPNCTDIHDAIDALLNLHQFKYLTAYVNTTKHRSLVQVQYTAHLNPTDNPRQGLRIKAFQYRKGQDNIESYDELWAEDFLFSEAQHVRNGILTIGKALNAFTLNNLQPNKSLNRTAGCKGRGSVSEEEVLTAEEAELRAAIEAVLFSPSRKKLVVAGPGTGKTTLFKRMLESASGDPSQRIVLTFLNNLRNDLDADLGELAQVFTLHSFCLGALHRDAGLRGSLSSDFHCRPGLASLIAKDWGFIEGTEAPRFVGEMRTLAADNNLSFYLARGNYYDAVDFDDTVYRAYDGFTSGRALPGTYDLVLIDEYQDFNRLEAGIIDALGKNSPILIAGDDDQALYSQLRDASWDHIRFLSTAKEYEVFKLPFCMRCPKVIVDAFNDILTKAQELYRLKGRIDKPYKHFPLAKGVDSAKYPKIANVETSVQSKKANYIGRFIAQEIAAIPEDEVKEAVEGGYPVALVIVANPYRDQIIAYLEAKGFQIDTKAEPGNVIDREMGLSILKEDSESNLGWRIVLGDDSPNFLPDVIVATAEGSVRLVDAIPVDYRESVLAKVDACEPPEDEEALACGKAAPIETPLPTVRVTSFEGAKGLSAQHVFIAGLHDGELPRNPAAIKDLEICKFVVGLTRTRKKCTLINTRNFGGKWKSPSSFILWIDGERLDTLKVDKAYWDSQHQRGKWGTVS